jgi:hypothetical protein
VRAEGTSYEEQGNITQSVGQRRSRQEGVDQEENLFCLEFDSPFSACAGADTGSRLERGESDDDDAYLGCGGSVERFRRQGLRPRDVHPPYEEPQGHQARAEGRAFWGGSLSKRLHGGAIELGHLQTVPCGQGRHLGAGESSGLSEQGVPLPPEPSEVSPAKGSKRQRLLKIGNWSDQQLRAAMAAVERGCPVQTTALDYDVPRSTLRSHVMGLTISRKCGRKPMLSPAEEDKLINYIHGMARYGHLLNLTELKIKVVEATQMRDTPFTDGIPRPGWLRWFHKSHPDISLRMS